MRKDSLFDLSLANYQLNEQCENIFNFLKKIHPFKTGKYNPYCLELRPIARVKSTHLRSLNLWNYDDKSKEYLLRFLKNINSKPACLYYSVFAFDIAKPTYDSKGKLNPKGHVNKDNAVYTQILVMDFDDITDEDYKTQKKRLSDLGIETISVFSGHGYQDIILLNRPEYDLSLLKKFTSLLLQKGFPVDSSIVDSARIMRLPFTFNCKAYDYKSKHHCHNPYGIKTYIASDTDKRYSVEEIFQRLNTLDDVIVPTTMTHESFSKKPTLDMATVIKDYHMIKNFKTFPIPVQRMLISTRQSFRNKAMMFLIPYFKNTLHFDDNKIVEIMKVWGRRCKPAYSEDFTVSETYRLLSYKCNLGYGQYPPDMKEEFGSLDNLFLLIDKNKRKIIVPNAFFKYYSVIPDGSVRIYFTMKYITAIENKLSWTAKEIMAESNISSTTFYRNIVFLVKNGFVNKTRAFKKGKECYMYSIQQQFNLHEDGYTSFDKNIVKNMLYNKTTGLSDGEMALYTYLCRISNQNKKCWSGQEKLGRAVGKKRNTVSQITSMLQVKGYIQKTDITTYCLDNNIDVKKITPLKQNEFFEFIINCYYEDFFGFKKHCIYTFPTALPVCENAS